MLKATWHYRNFIFNLPKSYSITFFHLTSTKMLILGSLVIPQDHSSAIVPIAALDIDDHVVSQFRLQAAPAVPTEQLVVPRRVLALVDDQFGTRLRMSALHVQNHFIAQSRSDPEPSASDSGVFESE